jgi:lipid-binding SYLF domain-containing protein
VLVALAVAGFGAGAHAQSDKAARRAELDPKADAALAQLYAEDAAAKTLGSQAEGLLIFPRIVEGGLIIGGLTGDGVLRVGGNTVGYDDTTAVTFGFQAGGQAFSQVLMFLDPAALETFRNSKGFEVGVDANVTVLGAGGAVNADISNLKDPIVAFVFGESGLMGAATIDGTTYTKKDL